jgi:hypothetical protein
LHLIALARKWSTGRKNVGFKPIGSDILMAGGAKGGDSA